jgi:hypothetical protein
MSSALQAELNAETQAATTNFDSLLQFASDAMLRDTTLYDALLADLEMQDEIGEHTLDVQAIGMWSLAATLDEGVPKPLTSEVVEEIIDDHVASDRLSLPFSRTIHNKIEAFGAAILEEAFSCLGPDAETNAQLLHDAQNDNEAIDAITWLIGRLYDIKELYENKEEDDEEEQADRDDEEPIYHPARLSPKFIGVFPEIKTEPTCLGYSILAASFFERAGVPYVHANVVSTSKDEVRSSVKITASTALTSLRERHVEGGLRDDVDDLLYKTFTSNRERLKDHRGFHAAVLAQIQEGVWLQVDPNYESNMIWNPDSYKPTDILYDQFIQKQDITRGLEQPFAMYVSMANYDYYRGTQHLLSVMPDITEVDKFLAEVSPEFAFSSIIEKYFQEFVDPTNEMINTRVFDRVSDFCDEMKKDPWKYVQVTIDRILTKYVFGSEGITASLERCKTDSAYRLRRAQDLANAPVLTMVAMSIEHANGVINNNIRRPHAVLEGGNPAYRIGISVLSDYAVYCGDELPLSFWLTYWPSQVSLAEHSSLVTSEAQQALRKQAAADIEDYSWRYRNFGDIVSSVHE